MNNSIAIKIDFGLNIAQLNLNFAGTLNNCKRKMTKEEFAEIEEFFIEHGEVKKQVQMEAYMKNRFKFLGITAPSRKELLSRLFKGMKWTREELIDFAKLCWHSSYRELQYAGQDMLMKKEKLLQSTDIELVEYFLGNKSWWDTVDALSVNVAGKLMKRHPEMRYRKVEEWMKNEDIWIKRAAILHQLKYKSDVDTKLMERTLLAANGTTEFFLNKAIGWMLREYSRTDSEYVMNFVEKNELSKLSRREALRLIS